MEVAHLVAFNLALLAAWVSPGPALLYAIRSTLAGGRAVGIATGCGLAVGAAGWTLTALLGLDGLLRLFPSAFLALKFAGAAYLIWVAWQTWRGAAEPVAADARPRGRAFRGGLLVNLANPKSVFFAAAVLVVIFPPDLGLGGKMLIVANHLIFEVLAYGAVAVLLARPAVSARYLRAKPALDRFAALVLGALGLRLLLDR